MAIAYRKIIPRILLYSLGAMIALSLYHRMDAHVETDEEYCKRLGLIKFHGKYFKYEVYQRDEFKTMVQMLTRECNHDRACELDSLYQYVLKIPYAESNSTRTPSEVIIKNGGDCDEKSFLLASLFLQSGYECIFMTTPEHGFIAVHLDDSFPVRFPTSYVSIDNKKYYFAESTFGSGYIGKYNNIKVDSIDGIYDMSHKVEIPREKAEFHIFSEKR